VAKENGFGTFKFSPAVELLDGNKNYINKALSELIGKNGKPSILMRGQDFVIKDPRAIEWVRAMIQAATDG